VLKSGGVVEQVNMGWDEVGQRTVLQRGKESSEDYRYFPEPDLAPLVVDRDWVEDLRLQLPELPRSKRLRYVELWGLRSGEADALVSESLVAAFFEGAVADYGEDAGRPQRMANWITGELFRLLYADGAGQDLRQIAEMPIGPEQIASLLALVDEKVINQNTGKKVLDTMYATGRDPRAIIEEQGLAMVSDAGVIDEAISQTLAAYPDELTRYREGEEKLLGFFMGQVMRATKGKADPNATRQRLLEMLDAS